MRSTASTRPFRRSLIAALAFLAGAAALSGAARAGSRAGHGTIQVAAAASLGGPMKEIADRYREETGVTVKLSFGASGSLVAQIAAGAPYDLFFSADRSYPESLAARGEIEPGSLFTYGVGRLVLWVPRGSNLDVSERGAETLLDGSVKKIAVADPRHAPYGVAAVAALRALNLYDQVQSKLVYGENVAQALQFCVSGAAQAALVSLTQVTGGPPAPEGRWWTVPPAVTPPLEQAAAVLKGARGRGRLKAAQAFAAWVRGERGQAILAHYGLAAGAAPE